MNKLSYLAVFATWYLSRWLIKKVLGNNLLAMLGSKSFLILRCCKILIAMVLERFWSIKYEEKQMKVNTWKVVRELPEKCHIPIPASISFQFIKSNTKLNDNLKLKNLISHDLIMTRKSWFQYSFNYILKVQFILPHSFCPSLM